MFFCVMYMHQTQRWKNIFFIYYLNGLIEKWERIILMGDFNTVFSRMDITNDMVYKRDSGREELLKLMDKHELIDIWREDE